MSPGEVLLSHTSYELTEWMGYLKAVAFEQNQAESKQKNQSQASSKRGRRRS